ITEAPSACSGTPDAATATLSMPSNCSGQSFSITGSNLAAGAGIGYFWQSSSDGDNWSDISGATQALYTSTVSTGTTYYRLATHCDNSDETSYSNVVAVNGVSCQTVLMPANGTTFITCGSSSFIYDSGGAAGNYSLNSDGTVVLQNSGTSIITITGTLASETEYDFIYFYSGVGTGGTLLGQYSGTGTLPTLTSAPGQSITVRFTADDFVVGGGFALMASYSAGCATPPACTDLTSPADGATGLTTMFLEWEAADGDVPVASYDVMIGTTPSNMILVTNV